MPQVTGILTPLSEIQIKFCIKWLQAFPTSILEGTWEVSQKIKIPSPSHLESMILQNM